MDRTGKTGRIRNKMAAVLSLAAVLMVTTMSAAVPINALAANPIPQIKLSVGNGQDTPSFQAEQEAHLDLKVENQGSIMANNVKITPVLDDAANWPFDIQTMNYEQKMGNIDAGKEATAGYDFVVRSDVATGRYRLVFSFVYDDGQDEYQIEKYIYVNIQAKEKPQEEPPAEEQEQPDSGISAYEGMSAGGGDFSTSDPIVTGGGSANSGSGSTSVPRVIVTGFNTDPGNVSAGSNFNLIVHLKNTSSTTAVSNMLFDLTSPSTGSGENAEAPAFLPASGSSTVYLDNIPAGGSKDISLTMNARADLIQKPYSIQMAMKYEDGNKAQHEATSSLAVSVKQPARFEFSEFEISPDSIAIGEEANITTNLYNTGRVKLYNVKAKYVGTGISGKEVFVGNLDSGATGVIDGMLTGTKEMGAAAKCKMVVTYEDDAGSVSTVEKEFSLEVTAASEDTAAAMPVKAEKQGLPILPIAGGVVVVIGVIVTVIVIKHKKKKNNEEEDFLDELDRSDPDEQQ